MVVILAAAKPGLHTPSLRLPYLYANSGGLQTKRQREGEICQAHLYNRLSIIQTHFSASETATVKQRAAEAGRGR